MDSANQALDFFGSVRNCEDIPNIKRLKKDENSKEISKGAHGIINTKRKQKKAAKEEEEQASERMRKKRKGGTIEGDNTILLTVEC